MLVQPNRGIYVILNSRWRIGSLFLTVSVITLRRNWAISWKSERKKNVYFFRRFSFFEESNLNSTKKCQFSPKNSNLFIHQYQISAHNALHPSKMLVQSEINVSCRSVEMGFLWYLVFVKDEDNQKVFSLAFPAEQLRYVMHLRLRRFKTQRNLIFYQIYMMFLAISWKFFAILAQALM